MYRRSRVPNFLLAHSPIVARTTPKLSMGTPGWLDAHLRPPHERTKKKNHKDEKTKQNKGMKDAGDGRCTKRDRTTEST